jgi:membrane protein DedA with SNARE-associated domain
MQLINQYSFPFLAGVIILILAGILLRKGGTEGLLVPLAAMLVGFLVAFWLFSPGASAETSAAASVEDAIGSGKAVLLEFQSPY